MKIEMGESLCYSWLRHVKKCQVVQTNWKVSPQWTMRYESSLIQLMEKTDRQFSDKYGYKIFKQNASLSQIIQQGECDAVGIRMNDGGNKIYAVDVAFHENGLNYGGRDTTVMKIIAKSIRTAMCLYGYLDCGDAEIIFASPKIHTAIHRAVMPCIAELNALFCSEGYGFDIKVIANEEFNRLVLQPTLSVSDSVADTSELFLRSYQMFMMFSEDTLSEKHTAESKSFQQTKQPLGNINKNHQRNNGRMQVQGTDHHQWFYEMECMNCGHKYFANGSDVWQRKCPNCQGGRP